MVHRLVVVFLALLLLGASFAPQLQAFCGEPAEFAQCQVHALDDPATQGIAETAAEQPELPSFMVQAAAFPPTVRLAPYAAHDPPFPYLGRLKRPPRASALAS